MGRSGRVYCSGSLAGRIERAPDGYRFVYDAGYLALADAKPVSLTLPRRVEPFLSKVLFPFFYGLLAEGILKETQCPRAVTPQSQDVWPGCSYQRAASQRFAVIYYDWRGRVEHQWNAETQESHAEAY